MAYNQATDLLSFCLIWHGFHDLRRKPKYWKFLPPIFQQTGHFNYAKKAFILLAQDKFLSSRKASELKWSRTVNTQGRQGCNILIDLHNMEHLNRRLKFMMGNLHPNTKPLRVAKSLNVVEHVCQAFHAEAGVTPNKGYSSVPSFQNDFNHRYSLYNHMRCYIYHRIGNILKPLYFTKHEIRQEQLTTNIV